MLNPNDSPQTVIMGIKIKEDFREKSWHEADEFTERAWAQASEPRPEEKRT
jgi:hypothetical protein